MFSAIFLIRHNMQKAVEPKQPVIKHKEPESKTETLVKDEVKHYTSIPQYPMIMDIIKEGTSDAIEHFIKAYEEHLTADKVVKICTNCKVSFGEVYREVVKDYGSNVFHALHYMGKGFKKEEEAWLNTFKATIYGMAFGIALEKCENM